MSEQLCYWVRISKVDVDKHTQKNGTFLTDAVHHSSVFKGLFSYLVKL